MKRELCELKRHTKAPRKWLECENDSEGAIWRGNVFSRLLEVRVKDPESWTVLSAPEVDFALNVNGPAWFGRTPFTWKGKSFKNSYRMKDYSLIQQNNKYKLREHIPPVDRHLWALRWLDDVKSWSSCHAQPSGYSTSFLRRIWNSRIHIFAMKAQKQCFWLRFCSRKFWDEILNKLMEPSLKV